MKLNCWLSSYFNRSSGLFSQLLRPSDTRSSKSCQQTLVSFAICLTHQHWCMQFLRHCASEGISLSPNYAYRIIFRCFRTQLQPSEFEGDSTDSVLILDRFTQQTWVPIVSLSRLWVQILLRRHAFLPDTLSMDSNYRLCQPHSYFIFFWTLIALSSSDQLRIKLNMFNFDEANAKTKKKFDYEKI